MGEFSDLVMVGVMALAAVAAVAGHMAGRPVLGEATVFTSTVGKNDTVRFSVEAVAGGYCADCCSVEELIEAVLERRGQVLRITDLEANDDEYVEVMQDGSTWYPWASRHRVDLATRFGA